MLTRFDSHVGLFSFYVLRQPQGCVADCYQLPLQSMAASAVAVPLQCRYFRLARTVAREGPLLYVWPIAITPFAVFGGNYERIRVSISQNFFQGSDNLFWVESGQGDPDRRVIHENLLTRPDPTRDISK